MRFYEFVLKMLEQSEKKRLLKEAKREEARLDYERIRPYLVGLDPVIRFVPSVRTSSASTKGIGLMLLLSLILLV